MLRCVVKTPWVGEIPRGLALRGAKHASHILCFCEVVRMSLYFSTYEHLLVRLTPTHQDEAITFCHARLTHHITSLLRQLLSILRRLFGRGIASQAKAYWSCTARAQRRERYVFFHSWIFVSVGPLLWRRVQCHGAAARFRFSKRVRLRRFFRDSVQQRAQGFFQITVLETIAGTHQLRRRNTSA